MSVTTVSKTMTLRVAFDYQPREPGNNVGEGAEITSVSIGDIDITKALSQEDFADLEILVLESLDGECSDYEPWVDDGWRLRREAC